MILSKKDFEYDFLPPKLLIFVMKVIIWAKFMFLCWSSNWQILVIFDEKVAISGIIIDWVIYSNHSW